jgi:NAD(P)-dependent dehydrogenase (short-subunit alcohol dehydrogenase family)
MTMTEAQGLKKVAFVTGSSRGIGRSIALGLAKAGYHVIAAARSKTALEELDDEIFAATGQHASLLPVDLSQGELFVNMAETLKQRFGKIDLVVHAAAILGGLSPVSHYDDKDMERLMRTNIMGTWRIIMAMEPLLRLSEAGRAIFLTTSASVTKGRAFWGPYGASKAALETLVRAWQDEISEVSNIRTAILNPGAMRTRMRAAAFPGEDPLSLHHPDEIVPLVLELADPVATPSSDTVNFQDWKTQKITLS